MDKLVQRVGTSSEESIGKDGSQGALGKRDGEVWTASSAVGAMLHCVSVVEDRDAVCSCVRIEETSFMVQI